MTTDKAIALKPEQGLALLEKRYGAFKVPDARKQAMALIACGWDPNLHIMIYQDRPMIVIDGWGYMVGKVADRRGMRIPRMTSHPIPASDRIPYALREDEIGVIARMFDPQDGTIMFEGFGKASNRPYTYDAKAPWAEKEKHPDRLRNPIEAVHPFRMAEKRAEAQCWRKYVAAYGQLESAVPEIYDGPSTIRSSSVREGDVLSEREALLERCPKHGIAWTQQSKDGPYGRSHSQKDSSTGWCNLRDVMRARLKISQDQLGWEEKQVNEWLKGTYSSTWGTLKDESRIDACFLLEMQASPPAPEPEPDPEPEPQEEAGS